MNLTFLKTMEIGGDAMGFGVLHGVYPLEAVDHDGDNMGGLGLVEAGVGAVELRDALLALGPLLVQKHYHHFAVGRVGRDGPPEVLPDPHRGADERRVLAGPQSLIQGHRRHTQRGHTVTQKYLFDITGHFCTRYRGLIHGIKQLR